MNKESIFPRRFYFLLASTLCNIEQAQLYLFKVKDEVAGLLLILVILISAGALFLVKLHGSSEWPRDTFFSKGMCAFSFDLPRYFHRLWENDDHANGRC